MPSKNERGSSADRRARRAFLLRTFGDGVTCPCVTCGKMLDDKTVTVDRILPGHEGGRYVRSNIQPMCLRCAGQQGASITNRKKRAA